MCMCLCARLSGTGLPSYVIAYRYYVDETINIVNRINKKYFNIKFISFIAFLRCIQHVIIVKQSQKGFIPTNGRHTTTTK